jgi:spermidine synthase
MMPHNTNQTIALYVVLFLSGIAGLGYEMVWTRMLMVGLGHEIIAVLAVVAAFFSGLALGAWALDRKISQSHKPEIWYAVLECSIGCWALLLTFFIPAVNASAHYLIGVDPSPFRHWILAFLLPFVLLLPATFSMGATLPAIERFFVRLRSNAQPIGGLYAANTCGAVMGTLATTYLLVPALGFNRTSLLLAVLNFACSGLILRGHAKLTAPVRPRMSNRTYQTPSPALLGIILLTGFLGIGFEVVVIRVLSQVFENTVYSFASILSVYLLGTAAGAALYQVHAPRAAHNKTLHYLLSATSALCLVSLIVLNGADAIYAAARNAAGSNFFGSLTGEIATAGLVFFLPCTAMGATFSHLAQTASTTRGGMGRALGLNTLGASLAPFLFGIGLLPLLGSKNSLLIISCGYAFLALVINIRKAAPVLLIALCALLILCSPVQLEFVTVPDGGSIREHHEGVMAAVTVVEDAHGDRFLKVNDKFQMGSTAGAFVDKRLAHIPLLLHAHPDTALFLGLGTGTTFAAAAEHPGLRAEGVELIPEIIPMLRHFQKSTGDFSLHQNLHISIADARRFVNAAPQRYDVIVADLFHPARDGAGTLYTVEHFSAIKARLAAGGLFCQWLPLYQMDAETLRVIIRTFLHVYPHASAYIACYSLDMPILGLVGAHGPLRYPIDWYEQRVKTDSLRITLQNLRLPDIYELLGCFIAESSDLALFAGSGPLNTDDNPVVMFVAPRSADAADRPSYETLFTLLTASSPKTAQVLAPAHNAQQDQVHQRLADYWSARDIFLRAGAGMARPQNPGELLASIREPLLACVRKSRDFAAAYNPLLALAHEMYRAEPSVARDLLLALEAAQPASDRARMVRNKLFPEN